MLPIQSGVSQQVERYFRFHGVERRGMSDKTNGHQL